MSSHMGEATQKVSINGESKSIPAPITVAGLLDHLGVDRKHVAVERNRAIVAKADHPTTAIEPDDQLEIVTFVGGG